MAKIRASQIGYICMLTGFQLFVFYGRYEKFVRFHTNNGHLIYIFIYQKNYLMLIKNINSKFSSRICKTLLHYHDALISASLLINIYLAININ